MSGTPDLINAGFEFIAAFMLVRNCIFTWKAKKVEGISILSTIFFASWGYWNIFYYPHLGQMLSFVAGVLVTIINTIWVWQMIYYRRKTSRAGRGGAAMSDYYGGCDWYLENYIISEQMENYRLNSFWHHWLHRGLLAAIAGDGRFIVGWEILDSESV